MDNIAQALARGLNLDLSQVLSWGIILVITKGLASSNKPSLEVFLSFPFPFLAFPFFSEFLSFCRNFGVQFVPLDQCPIKSINCFWLAWPLFQGTQICKLWEPQEGYQASLCWEHSVARWPLNNSKQAVLKDNMRWKIGGRESGREWPWAVLVQFLQNFVNLSNFYWKHGDNNKINFIIPPPNIKF